MMIADADSSEGQIRRLNYEVVRFVKGCEMEQAHRLDGYIPDAAEYIELRLAASSVDLGPCILE
jgi:hypothetical protein